ncbi:MAG: hypothetical protein KF699_11330 [Phycisphaeraceae bacterium]|nr:hypothetical protein [Phycisphaeraceae bacterium]
MLTAAEPLHVPSLPFPRTTEVPSEVRAVEVAIARFVAAKAGWDRQWRTRLDDARAAFEARLNDHMREVESRLAAHVQRVDTMLATVDRRSAAAQARLALAADGADERLASIERRAADLAGPMLDEFESLFRCAQRLLGNAEEPGALAAAVRQAEQTVTDCNDAAIRLGAMMERAAA